MSFVATGDGKRGVGAAQSQKAKAETKDKKSGKEPKTPAKSPVKEVSVCTAFFIDKNKHTPSRLVDK